MNYQKILPAALLALSVLAYGSAHAQIITTIAGNGTNGFSGDGGLATAAVLGYPTGVAVDAGGNVYIADSDNHRIRKVASGTGIITTIAGKGTAGFSGDGGLATNAELNGQDLSVAVDNSGNLYIADEENNRIRKVTASTGIISTIAGIGTPGFSGDGGLATAAELHFPYAVAIDAGSNIYIADASARIRKIAAGSAIISTFAGGGAGGNGGLATNAQLINPTDVIIDAAGNVYIAEAIARIRKVTAGTGIISTIAGNGISGYSGDGGLATDAKLNSPYGIAIDASGNVYIADSFNNRIRKVAAGTGIISTFAGGGTGGLGDGGLATAARLSNPEAIAIDASGNVYIADWGNSCIRKVSAPCNYALAATTASFSAASGKGSVAVSAGTTCTWSVSASCEGFVSITNPNGTGTGTVSYTVSANTGAARTCIVSIAGSTYTIMQSAGTSAVEKLQVGKSESVRIWPNPNSTGVLHIESAEMIEQVEVWDVLGRQVRSLSIAETPANTSTTLSVRELPKGIYLLKIKTRENNTIIRRIVVQ